MKKLLFYFIFCTFLNAEFIRYDVGNVVIDTSKKLMWSDDNNKFDYWNEALVYCNDLNISFTVDGESFLLSDWRLPSQNELITLISYTKTNHALPVAFSFNATINDSRYFSSTTYKKDETKVYGIRKEKGLDILLEKDTQHFVKCVRDLE